MAEVKNLAGWKRSEFFPTSQLGHVQRCPTYCPEHFFMKGERHLFSLALYCVASCKDQGQGASGNIA
jgi:hypothetical protein